MRKIIGILIVIFSFLIGLYVGPWLMFISPIIEVCKAFDAGLLTGIIIGITILKCMFAGAVTITIIYIGTSIGMYFVQD